MVVTSFLNRDDLTGNFGFREGFWGKLILRVEYKIPAAVAGTYWSEWRDAEPDDISILRKMGKL